MTEQWTDERLNQIAALLDRTAQQQAVNTEAIGELQQTIAANAEQQAVNTEAIGELRQTIREDSQQVGHNIEVLVGAVNSLVQQLQAEIPAIRDTTQMQAESIRDLIRIINRNAPES
jgi:uncharacterized protein HemY